MYSDFLKSSCARQWKRVKPKRRAGVATPLFSIYSENSAGIGELPDLALLADWCRATGITFIQLLPMNDVGFSFRPYDAESCFAIDPMYLSIEKLKKANIEPVLKDVAALRKKFPPRLHVNYDVKRAKLEILRKVFDGSGHLASAAVGRFARAQREWLRPYCAFRVLKEKQGYRSWEEWPLADRRAAPDTIARALHDEPEAVRFHEWLQWQLLEQFKDARAACFERGVLLMGDLPFLVSRDSADVWAHQGDYKLDLAAGAPPDLLFAKGQKWGMPPYHWESIAARGYDTVKQKLKYADNFYDLFRIDHFVGLFRLWSFPIGADEGFFDPPDERTWESHGRAILDAMVSATRMLPCAEDLGTVPDCSFRVLKEYSIPGMDVQRWMKTGWETYDFKTPGEYRPHSLATVSTHDLTPLRAWWEYEAGTVDETTFRKQCEGHGIEFDTVKSSLFDLSRRAHGRLRWNPGLTRDALLAVVGRDAHTAGDLIDGFRATADEREKFWKYVGLEGEPDEQATPRLMRGTLAKASETASVFAGHLLQDWLSIGKLPQTDSWSYRINFPGTTDDRNWTLAMPFSLEKMKTLPANRDILEINRRTGRCA